MARSKDRILDAQRLADLAAGLALTEVSTALSRIGDEAPQPHLRSAGQQVLRELAARQAALLPPLPGSAEKWERLAPVLLGLEQMSRREIEHLDEAARHVRSKIGARIDDLPVLWRAKCRTVIAKAVSSPGGPLGRRLAASVRSICRDVARETHQALLRRLIDHLDTLYPFAVTADRMLSAMEHEAMEHEAGVEGPEGRDDLPEAPSLVARLAERHDRWRGAGDAADAPDEDVGALTSVLGAAVVPTAFDTVSFDAMLSGPAEPGETDAERVQRLGEAALEAVRATIAGEWRARRRAVLEALEGHIAERYTALQREIDAWHEQARRRLAALCGRPTEDRERLEAVRFEVLDICLRAEEAARQEESP